MDNLTWTLYISISSPFSYRNMESMEEERGIHSIDGFDAITGILMLTDIDEQVEEMETSCSDATQIPTLLQEKIIQLVEVG